MVAMFYLSSHFSMIYVKNDSETAKSYPLLPISTSFVSIQLDFTLFQAYFKHSTQAAFNTSGLQIHDILVCLLSSFRMGILPLNWMHSHRNMIGQHHYHINPIQQTKDAIFMPKISKNTVLRLTARVRESKKNS